MESSSEDEFMEEIIAAADSLTNETLPAISKPRYLKTYEVFNKWKAEKKIKKTCETALKAYFHQMSQDKKPNSLWAYHSMLKTMLRIRENIDIGEYHQVNAFLKTKIKGYKPIKAKVFLEIEMGKFIFEADDYAWLDVKIVCIFGLCGALRCCEFVKITIGDVDDHGRLYLVQVRDTKNKEDRSFTITGAFYEIVKKYVDLRPINAQANRFFLNYQKGKCTCQPIGKQKIAKMPRQIAMYLNLQNPDDYTGHTIRRTSATFLANSGAGMEMVQRLGGWNSAAVAQGYVETSIDYMSRTGDAILGAVCGTDTVPSPSTSSRSCSTVASSSNHSHSSLPSASNRSTFSSSNSRSSLPSTSNHSRSSLPSMCNRSTFPSVASRSTLPSTSTHSESEVGNSDKSFDLNCVASQGYAATEDDTIDDSVLATLGGEESVTLDEEMNQSAAKEKLATNSLSFSNCHVTINLGR